jgi:hypothetical protein
MLETVSLTARRCRRPARRLAAQNRKPVLSFHCIPAGQNAL